MNVMAILALLLSTGVCAKTQFTGPDHRTLQVVVCPLQMDDAPAAPPADKPEPNEPKSFPGPKTPT